MGFLSKEYFRNEYSREAIVTIQVLGKKALQYLPSIKGIFLTIREKSKVLKNLMTIVYTRHEQYHFFTPIPIPNISKEALTKPNTNTSFLMIP